MPPIYVLITLVGVIGNGLVVAVILLHKHMFNSTNVLIMGSLPTDTLICLRVLCRPRTRRSSISRHVHPIHGNRLRHELIPIPRMVV